MECRSPAVPSLRQPRPQHPIGGRQMKTADGAIDGQLVSERDDLQVQRHA
jgi:hypothetical protein